MGDKNFEKGYVHGQEDAASGEGKSSFSRPVKRLLQPDSFLPGGGNRIESYLGGYSTGYEDGTRVIQTQASTSNTQHTVSMSTTGLSMANSNSLEHQLELLHQLTGYLKSVQDQLDSMRTEYGRRVAELREAGMIHEHHEYLQRNIFNPTESALLKFIEHVQARDLTTVRKEIGFVEAEIDRLRTYDE
jgi:hypothetical protein